MSTLPFPKPAPIHDLILNTVSAGGWWMPHELRDELLRRHNVMVSDATVTARLRDMRKRAYGAHTVELRRQGNAFAYRFVRCQNAPAVPERFEVQA